MKLDSRWCIMKESLVMNWLRHFFDYRWFGKVNVLGGPASYPRVAEGYMLLRNLEYDIHYTWLPRVWPFHGTRDNCGKYFSEKFSEIKNSEFV